MADKPALNRPYLAFSLDTPEEMAWKRFLEKYGYPPQEIHRYKGLLWLGPVDTRGPQAEPQADQRPASLLRRAEAAAKPLTPERARQLVLTLEVTDAQ